MAVMKFAACPRPAPKSDATMPANGFLLRENDRAWQLRTFVERWRRQMRAAMDIPSEPPSLHGYASHPTQTQEPHFL